MPTPLQEEMLKQFKDKDLFQQAQTYSDHYLDTVLNRNVYPSAEALANLESFEEDLQSEKADASEVLALLQEKGNEATVATLGGRYFGFVTGSVVPIGLAAKNMASYWDQSPSMEVLSPLAAKLESVVQSWFIDILNLPKSTVAGFVSGTSAGNICGIAAARFSILRKQGWDVVKKGLYQAPPIKIVTGKHAHSTILKSVGLLGMGHDSIQMVEVDDQGKIVLDDLPRLDENTLVILQAGNVNSGSFDAFEPICKLANAAGAWVHIDGAFGLWAGAVSELKHLTKGIELADSWVLDGHKTLNTPYDSGVVLCKDPSALSGALSMTAGYIITTGNRNGMFYTPEMSKRARVVEMWAIMKYLGKSGISDMVYTMHLRAKQFAKAVAEIEGFEVLNEVVFNQVLVSCSDDARTKEVLSKIQSQRVCWLGGSTWFGKSVMRVSFCSWVTTKQDVEQTIESFKDAIKA